MNRFLTPFRGSLPGFIAQGFTLASALFPIVIGREDVLVYLLTVAAPVTIVINAVCLGTQTRLPMASQPQRFTRLSASLSGVLLSTSCLSAFFICVMTVSGDMSLQRFVFGLLILLPCQALYFIALALGTAELSYSKLMYARLLYGSVTFIGTVIMGLAHCSPLAFLMVNSFGYFCGAIPVGLTYLSLHLFRALAVSTLSFRGFRDELVAARYVIMASLVSGLGSQIGALATPLVPAAQAGLWATAVRIMTGLQTVGGQILGPKIDIELLTRIRGDKPSAVKQVWRKGVLTGACLGVVCVLTSAAGMALVTSHSVSLLIITSMLIYTVTCVFLSPIDRCLTLLGGQRERLVWDFTRAALGLALVFFAPGSLLLISLAALGLFSLLSYIYLLERRVKGSSSLDERSPSTTPERPRAAEEVR